MSIFIFFTFRKFSTKKKKTPHTRGLQRKGVGRVSGALPAERR